jgi:hypothetical protein
VDRRQKAWFLPAAHAEGVRMRKSDGLLGAAFAQFIDPDQGELAASVHDH